MHRAWLIIVVMLAVGGCGEIGVTGAFRRDDQHAPDGRNDIHDQKWFCLKLLGAGYARRCR